MLWEDFNKAVKGFEYATNITYDIYNNFTGKSIIAHVNEAYGAKVVKLVGDSQWFGRGTFVGNNINAIPDDWENALGKCFSPLELIDDEDDEDEEEEEKEEERIPTITHNIPFPDGYSVSTDTNWKGTGKALYMLEIVESKQDEDDIEFGLPVFETELEALEASYEHMGLDFPYERLIRKVCNND